MKTLVKRLQIVATLLSCIIAFACLAMPAAQASPPARMMPVQESRPSRIPERPIKVPSPRNNVEIIPTNEIEIDPDSVGEEGVILKFLGGNNQLGYPDSGDELEGYLFLPSNVAPPFNVVIIAHGSGGVLSSDVGLPNTAAYSGRSSLKNQFDEGWLDPLLQEKKWAVFLPNSFKSSNRFVGEQYEGKYQGIQPPDDRKFSPYRVRAADLLLATRRLRSLKDQNSKKRLFDKVAWLGFSHGATAVIAATHRYESTAFGELGEMEEWSVKCCGDQKYDEEDGYGPPTYPALFTETFPVKAAVAYYGGPYGFGYFIDYYDDPDDNNDPKEYKYSPRYNIKLMVHFAEEDAITYDDDAYEVDCEVSEINQGCNSALGFKNHVERIVAQYPHLYDFRFLHYPVGHGFDNPPSGGEEEPMDVTTARNTAREATLNFIEEKFNS